MLMVYAPTAILKCHLYQDSASAQQTYPSKINNNVNLVNCKMNNNVNKEEALVKMVTLPHGLDHQDDRSDVAKLFVSMKTIMPALLPKLIQHIDASDVGNKITYIRGLFSYFIKHCLNNNCCFLFTPATSSGEEQTMQFRRK
ncbi:hypothetical protein LR48_Vigan01g118700 [Vigna angularis]|uniref:Uncharacterized protein n=2 Tax=Phaseolus angularis TaxID=3914 RepID=A0A0L9TMG7_PHAAN|nr:hypothetical protein LR48_Vigan01g118700 [Vigna angularis]BAU01892.1 hypothetical protein VIGAN_11123700 [Vigna angularis var. angularis]